MKFPWIKAPFYYRSSNNIDFSQSQWGRMQFGHLCCCRDRASKDYLPLYLDFYRLFMFPIALISD